MKKYRLIYRAPNGDTWHEDFDARDQADAEDFYRTAAPLAHEHLRVTLEGPLDLLVLARPEGAA